MPQNNIGYNEIMTTEEKIQEILEETWGETKRAAYKEAVVRLSGLIENERKTAYEAGFAEAKWQEYGV